MIPPFLISFLSTNALKIGIVVAVITAVGGGLWYIQHQAYDKGYKEGYAEMEVLHNTEVAKSAKEVARIISDNAKRYEEETKRITKNLQDSLNAKQTKLNDLNARYNDAVRAGMYYTPREDTTSSRDTTTTQTPSSTRTSKQDTRIRQDRLDSTTTEAILETGRMMQETAINCNVLLDLVEPHIELID